MEVSIRRRAKGEKWKAKAVARSKVKSGAGWGHVRDAASVSCQMGGRIVNVYRLTTLNFEVESMNFQMCAVLLQLKARICCPTRMTVDAAETAGKGKFHQTRLDEHEARRTIVLVDPSLTRQSESN